LEDELVAEVEVGLQAVKQRLQQDLNIRRQQLEELRRIFGVSK